jgi:hypothetical protein
MPYHQKRYDLLITYIIINRELAKFGIGRVVGEVLHRFDDLITGKSKAKMVIYSGHDSTVAPLLGALGVR